jgi:hypothetical protein
LAKRGEGRFSEAYVFFIVDSSVKYVEKYISKSPFRKRGDRGDLTLIF